MRSKNKLVSALRYYVMLGQKGGLRLIPPPREAVLPTRHTYSFMSNYSWSHPACVWNFGLFREIISTMDTYLQVHALRLTSCSAWLSVCQAGIANFGLAGSSY